LGVLGGRCRTHTRSARGTAVQLQGPCPLQPCRSHQGPTRQLSHPAASLFPLHPSTMLSIQPCWPNTQQGPRAPFTLPPCLHCPPVVHRTAPHRTAPHRTAPHRTAPHRTAPHRTARPCRPRLCAWPHDSAHGPHLKQAACSGPGGPTALARYPPWPHGALHAPAAPDCTHGPERGAPEAGGLQRPRRPDALSQANHQRLDLRGTARHRACTGLMCL
jgi:hypothetical protein